MKSPTRIIMPEEEEEEEEKEDYPIAHSLHVNK
jgi:hypothetical protein